MAFKNRIVRTGLEPLDSILFHPDNWRIHPTRQQDGVRGSLHKVGWVEPVMINLRTGEGWPAGQRGVATMIDGHMRVTLAARNSEKEVPAVYVDLEPEEESFILATLDPLGALAVTDNAKLLELVKDMDSQGETLKAALRGAGIDVRSMFAHIEQEADEPEPEEPARQPKVMQAPEREPVASKPADRERYPLAIVLDREYYERWQAWKEICDERSDTAALRALLDNTTEEG